MEKSVTKMFVSSWTNEKVQCEMLDEKEIREFDREPLFEGMKLFQGKNVWLETERMPGRMIVKNNESKSSRLIQLWNYYIRQTF